MKVPVPPNSQSVSLKELTTVNFLSKLRKTTCSLNILSLEKQQTNKQINLNLLSLLPLPGKEITRLGPCSYAFCLPYSWLSLSTAIGPPPYSHPFHFRKFPLPPKKRFYQWLIFECRKDCNEYKCGIWKEFFIIVEAESLEKWLHALSWVCMFYKRALLFIIVFDLLISSPYWGRQYDFHCVDEQTQRLTSPIDSALLVLGAWAWQASPLTGINSLVERF